MEEKIKQIFKEYQKAMEYNSYINLNENVKNNENFFVGKQWENVNIPKGLDKPVINILKRVVAYFISIIVSDNIAVSISAFSDIDDMVSKILDTVFREIFELTNINSKNRDAIRNAAVDGDACYYTYFDTEKDMGDGVTGSIEIECLDNTNVFFGNSNCSDVQKQPYIIIRQRMTVKEVKKLCEDEKTKELIVADSETDSTDYELNEDNKVTLITKFYKKDGTIYAVKCTRTAIIKNDFDVGISLYPISWFCWDKIKNSYHGQACITGLIPNQVFINKSFAMAMQHIKSMAFPKYIYNKNLIPKWTNQVGEAIGVEGDPNISIAKGVPPIDMSNQLLLMIDKIIDYTRDTMGASDAALGNIKPENTSAIIAVQKSSAMPLEIQRLSFYQFIEDTVRICLEYMVNYYGVRKINVVDKDLNGEPIYFDFSELKDKKIRLNVDVGASTYWSEIMQVQTLDNLYQKGIIRDSVEFLEALPDGYIKNKQKIIDDIKQAKEEQLMVGQNIENISNNNMLQGLDNINLGGDIDDMSLLQS